MERSMKTVVVGMLGTTVDRWNGDRMHRWEQWRPTVSLCQQEDLVVDRLELVYPGRSRSLAREVAADIEQVSPETEVRLHLLDWADPWDFEEVYGSLMDFCQGYPWASEEEHYLVHLTTGTHVAQICWFLLTESRHFPGRLIQTSPPSRTGNGPGRYAVIDLDLSRYDSIAARFQKESAEGLAFLKGGIETRNAAFNRMIEEIEQVAIHSRAPILIEGPTGSGKSQLARRIYALKQSRRLIDGPLISINCGTLRGDSAMAALFGHTRGAFTGASGEREGLLRAAHGGLLFLDEIGELGLDEQAMLLHAIEEKRYRPMGSDREVQSDFQVIAGTNRDLTEAVEEGRFRSDLLARIHLWRWTLPGLSQRREDIEPNLHFECRRFEEETGRKVRFSNEALQRYLAFATSEEAVWSANFRDLSGSVTRMATLAGVHRISLKNVEDEIARLQAGWRRKSSGEAGPPLESFLGPGRVKSLDLFDRLTLEAILPVCRSSASLSEAGRRLFQSSRKRRATTNDADRLRKYLERHGLNWASLKQGLPASDSGDGAGQ